jgi:hypothetical protein
MAVIAARDPGFSLERDYYTRAVHWDEQQAQNQQNQRLGYRLSPVSTGPSALSVRLVDRNGEPVRGAVVRAEAFANARAANIRKLAFSEGAAGIYRVELGSARPGLWEFRFRVEHAGRVFTEVSRLDIPSGASAP